MKCILLSLITFTVILPSSFCESSDKPPESKEKTFPDLSDEKRLISEEKSEEDQETPLLRIDKEIVQELQNPTAPEVSFEIQLKILKNLVEYCNRLKYVYEGVKNNTVKKLQIAHKLVELKGPNFLKEEINDEKLKQVYNWDDESLEFFRDYIKDIKAVWSDIETNLKNKPKPLDIFLDKTLGATKT